MNNTILTMLNQFGGMRALFMVGAKRVTCDDARDAATFNLGRNVSGANLCELRYDAGADLYVMTFSRKSAKWEKLGPTKIKVGESVKVLKVFDDLYGDQLADVFYSYTKLYTRMPRLCRA